MRFTQLGAAAALTGLGSAILLPPTISDDFIKALPIDASTHPDRRVIEISCPGCPVVVPDMHGNLHHVAAENILRLNFSVAHGDSDQLLLNGNQVYPIDPSSENFMKPLSAAQLVKSPEDTWQQAAEPALGYALSVRNTVHMELDNVNLVAVHVDIVEVAGVFIDGIPGIDLRLVETPSGKLMLGDSQVSAPTSPSSSPNDDGQECTTLLCKWRAIIADRLSKLKGCGRKGRPNAQVEGPKHGGRPHNRPHGSRPHGSHRPFRHHRQKNGFSRLARNILKHVLVPVLIGVFVGILASLVGMLVGKFVIFVYRASRGRREQYALVEQDDEAVEHIEDDSKSFVEPPPTYEAVNVKSPE
ncbi:uncharacterized protein BP5553_00797 [Venustampulla echinocandica]|uniref:DUF7728 domain-containing protein n=1 Tax=Venustampulla echinocandica TaxID=2656787 RepID=A0A370TZ90_9HELO|nr:uncharacterized protein BP5553_00797 [Venustampulla echinocandica]RDL40818.1 hypothetical protein BP5553_00797 [Venustampulla echinocandica]